MEFSLKWVHMSRYELILRLDAALWLTIISKTPLTPRRAIKIQNRPKNYFYSPGEDTTKLILDHALVLDQIQAKQHVLLRFQCYTQLKLSGESTHRIGKLLKGPKPGE